MHICIMCVFKEPHYVRAEHGKTGQKIYFEPTDMLIPKVSCGAVASVYQGVSASTKQMTSHQAQTGSTRYS